MTAPPALAPSGLARRLFEGAAQPRRLAPLAIGTLLLYLAMVPTFHTMSDRGASLGSFEDAGSVTRSTEIVEEWGEEGRDAARLQLLIDLPFIVVYALFLAGACMLVAIRARRLRMQRLAAVGEVMAWGGPIAAACDLAQNLSLALILGGHHNQPWPRISATTAVVTRTLFFAALIFGIGGTAITLLRERRN